MKLVERNHTGTQRIGFKVFNDLKSETRDNLKVNITYGKWREYCQNVWNV